MTHSRVGDYFPATIIRDELVGVVDAEYLLHCNASGGKEGGRKSVMRRLTGLIWLF